MFAGISWHISKRELTDLEISCVFKLNSVQELGDLFNALKLAGKYAEYTKLEDDIRNRQAELEGLTAELQGLRKDKLEVKVETGPQLESQNPNTLGFSTITGSCGTTTVFRSIVNPEFL